MHLPFTYATGEALLYQSNHPIPGFSDGVHEKNGSKSKKCRSERAAREGLDPGSLLGALMSQDESVYVCQPALEPKLAFHSSFLGDQLGFSESESHPGVHNGWDVPGNGINGAGLPPPANSFDPLLSTLDSLSLGGQNPATAEEESCSNGELFRALESLGLSAEDLELLLLDERMIRVEMDPDRVPSLDDILTNDEILSYIHDSLEVKSDVAEEEGPPPPVLSQTTAATVLTPMAVSPHKGIPAFMRTQLPQQKAPLVGQAPITLLSQQMQQHLSMSSGKAGQDWVNRNHRSGLNGDYPVQGQPLTNGQWSARDTLHGSGTAAAAVRTGHYPAATQGLFNGKALQLNGEQQQQQQQHQAHPLYLQPQPQQQQHPAAAQGPLALLQCHTKQNGENLNGPSNGPGADHPLGKSQWQDFGFGHPPRESLCGLSNGQAPVTAPSLDACIDFAMPELQSMDYPVNGGGLYQGVEAAVSSYQRMNHKHQQEQHFPPPLAQVLSGLSQCPTPTTALEQILGLNQPCRQLDPYGVGTPDIAHDSNHSKVSYDDGDDGVLVYVCFCACACMVVRVCMSVCITHSSPLHP